MKKTAITLLMMLVLSIASYAQSFDSLKKEYAGYKEADRPKDALAVLERIQAKARSERADWYFYWASQEKMSTNCEMDWKRYSEYEQEMHEELTSYGSPVIDMYEIGFKKDELESFIKDNANRLKSGRHEEFYRDWSDNGIFIFSPALPSLIENDYEFGLWKLLSFDRKYKDVASDFFLGRYPQEALVEFACLDTSSEKDCEEYSRKYSGKAVSLFSENCLLELRNRKLVHCGSATSDDFRALRRDCVEFGRTVKGFSGKERLLSGCCPVPHPLIAALDAKDLDFSISDSELTVIFRNHKETVFTLKDESGKVVYHERIVDAKGSYYLKDTVKVRLPVLDDGRYILSTDWDRDRSVEDYYEKYTLSLYSRKDIRGTGIFVADHITGEPLEKVNLTLVSGEQTREFKDVHLEDGFTYIPCQLDSRSSNLLTVWFVDASGRRRSSDELSLGVVEDKVEVSENLSAHLLTDKGAYNPGERIKYKVILFYKGVELRHTPAGMNLEVTFAGPDGKDFRTDVLTTNDMGSANGSFCIGQMERMGYCSISVKVNGRTLAHESVRVDEYVLPEYDVIWKNMGAVLDSEGRILLEGRVICYSGKPLDPGSLRYELSSYWYGKSSGHNEENGVLECAADGSFVMERVVPKDAQRTDFVMTVKIVDSVGQVQEFRNMWIGGSDIAGNPRKKTYAFSRLDCRDSIGVELVAGEKTVWVLAELFGRGAEVLERQLIRIDPGEDGVSRMNIVFPYKKEYPELMQMSLHYFTDGRYHHWEECARKHPDAYDLPVEFTHFTDRAAPQSSNLFRVHTLPDVEACLSIYDKSTNDINSNDWRLMKPLTDSAMAVPYYTEVCGRDGNSGFHRFYMVNNMMAAKSAVLDEEVPSMWPDMSGIKVRSDFRTSLAWEPELRSDKNGDIEFNVTAADKLSTFIVQIFAHDRNMRNAVLNREMLVTLPVQLTAQPPRYLYDGDHCMLRFSLSNNFDRAVKGTFSAEGKEIRFEIPANGTIPVGIDLDVTGLAGSEKTVTAVFRPEDAGFAGDAVRISIPVRSQQQTLVEAHSAVLPFGADPAALEEELRSRFVNVPGSSASVSCISIKEMLDEALPESLVPQADNVIDNLNTLYSDALLRKMDRPGLDDKRREEIRGKVLGCLNADGGFSWFKGMKSSPLITAWVMATSARAGLEGIVNAYTAAYLDASVLGEENTPAFRFVPFSVEAYAYVRSLYPQFAFKTSGLDRKALKAFRKSLKKALVPSGNRGKQGNTSGKVHRILTLNALLEAPDLAKAWGLGSVRKMRLSIEADMESLRQYACPHHDGGVYFPGASGALFRILDGELYVHTLLCELFDGTEIADGIRLWFMLQKETQQWKTDPAFVEALACVMKAPREILDTKVLALRAEFTLPFGDIRASGNGFTIQTSYFKDGKRISEGDTLKVGDRVTEVTDLSSEDMRSFVKLTVPRPANLRPVDQKSSSFWGGWYTVRADRTDYWLETCGEKMQVREDCFVTAEGCFHSAARSVECLYAPHYRANEKAPEVLVSRF